MAVIVGIGVWVAVDALSGGPSNSKPPTTALAARSSGTPGRSPSPKETPIVTASPRPTKTPTAKVPLITDGITVQVLNGTSDPGASDRVASRLGALGFKIVAVGSASTDYSHTTVFWAYPSAKPAAKALASHFGWIAAPKPENLSPQVAVHVVVGSDGL